MKLWVDVLLVLIVVANLSLLGSARLRTCIRIVAVQGVALGILPLLVPGDTPLTRLALQAAVSILLKAVVFPWLLQRAVRSVAITSEVEPYVGFPLSLLVGLALLGVSFIGAAKLPALQGQASALTVPAALFTLLVGLFVIVSRKKAVTQVLGYLAMENGIYAFGVALAEKEPFLVEMGILLDVFVGVFVMGIIIYHISREFDHVDTDRLSVLKD
jgi:hydrogenase-4 component E